jgi:hypothetical protein
MVLASSPESLRLADVLASCLLAVKAEDNVLGLSPVKKAAVLVVDGLGAANLAARSGHARWLGSHWATRNLVADSGYPSTTASALTTLTTGVLPGVHGIVGYTIRDPHSLALINHLKDWQPHVDPETWQLSQTLFEKAARDSIPSLALGEPRFDGTDFTHAVWRGATFMGVKGLLAQGERMREFFDANDRALAYLYWPALDRTGHSQGVNSDAWGHRLEELDDALQGISSMLRKEEGLVVTADHGMVDIADESKVLVEETSPLLDGVSAWAGEPRVPQLYTRDNKVTEDLQQAWSETLGVSAQVMTRERILDEGWLGPVSPEAMPRIGDLSIVCLDPIAVYRTSVASSASQAMIGQHGSITSVEREIPIIPLGDWG